MMGDNVKTIDDIPMVKITSVCNKLGIRRPNNFIELIGRIGGIELKKQMYGERPLNYIKLSDINKVVEYMLNSTVHRRGNRALVLSEMEDMSEDELKDFFMKKDSKINKEIGFYRGIPVFSTEEILAVLCLSRDQIPAKYILNTSADDYVQKERSFIHPDFYNNIIDLANGPRVRGCSKPYEKINKMLNLPNRFKR